MACPESWCSYGDTSHWFIALILNLLVPTIVGARINPYPANVEKMVSS